MGHFNWFEYIPGVKYGLNAHVVVFFLVAIALILLGLGLGAAVRKLAKSPQPSPAAGFSLQTVFEVVGEFIFQQVVTIAGSRKTAATIFPFACACFVVVFVSNVLGLIPGFISSTSSLNTTLALGAVVFIFYNYQGIKVHGVKKYLAHFAGPVWWIAPLLFVIELLSHVLRPVVLGLRLRSNIMADHMVLDVFLSNYPFVASIFYGLGLFVCTIQAFVFTMLTIVYVSMAMADDHAHHEDDHHHGQEKAVRGSAG